MELPNINKLANRSILKRTVKAFTLIELLAIIGLLVIFAAFMMPSLADRNGKSPTVRCMSNLREIILASLLRANDNNGQFPWAVSTNHGGSLEFANDGRAFRHFQSLSNYLLPTLLVCPTDKTRKPATDYRKLTDQNLSYFLNLDSSTNGGATEILSGDRNLEANGHPVSEGVFTVTTNLNVNWTYEMHKIGGNLGFADGHVQFVKLNALNEMIARQNSATNRFVIP